MKIKKDEYAIVNEVIKDGVTYQAWRNIEKPKDCLITYEGEVIKCKNLKIDWGALING